MTELRSPFLDSVVSAMATGAARWKTRDEIWRTGDFDCYATPIVFGEYEVVAHDRGDLVDVYRLTHRPPRHWLLSLLLGSGRYEYVGRCRPTQELRNLFKSRSAELWRGVDQESIDALDAAVERRRSR